MAFAPVDPTIDRVTPDRFGQTVNEGMNHTLGALDAMCYHFDIGAAEPKPEDFTEKEWKVIQALLS